MILQEQKRAFLCVEGGVDEGLAMLAARLACCEAFLVPQSMAFPLLTWTRGVCCPLVVIFSMVPLPLEVSYKPWFITNL